jgi:hypothetical protein
VAARLKTATGPERPAAKNVSLGLIFIPSVVPRAGKGEPATSVSPPLAAMLKTVMLFESEFPAIRNVPSGVIANDIPEEAICPVGKGGPIEVRMPVFGSMEKTLTSLLPSSEANKK